MKIIYEFDGFDPEDINKRKMFEKSTDMFISLWDIQAYIRQHNKGYIEDDLEKTLENITQLIQNAAIDEIE